MRILWYDRASSSSLLQRHKLWNWINFVGVLSTVCGFIYYYYLLFYSKHLYISLCLQVDLSFCLFLFDWIEWKALYSVSTLLPVHILCACPLVSSISSLRRLLSVLLPKQVAICWKQAVSLLKETCACSHSLTSLFLAWISPTDLRHRFMLHRPQLVKVLAHLELGSRTQRQPDLLPKITLGEESFHKVQV